MVSPSGSNAWLDVALSAVLTLYYGNEERFAGH
jgi:hypothetical protein